MTTEPTRPSRRVVRELIGVVLRRPDLWWAALGALHRLAPPGWWRTPPRLPLPDPRLWGFRMVTAYGSADADPEPGDVISYLEWCRSTGRGRGPGGRADVRPWPPSRRNAARSG